MTWGEFKAEVERRGAKDGDQLTRVYWDAADSGLSVLPCVPNGGISIVGTEDDEELEETE